MRLTKAGSLATEAETCVRLYEYTDPVVANNALSCRDESEFGSVTVPRLLRMALGGHSSRDGAGGCAGPLRHGHRRLSLYDRGDHGIRYEEEI